MKFLLVSNGPNIGTGYGVQCRHLATALAADGHDVAVAVTYGHQGGVGNWTTPLGDKVRLYPSGYLTNSDDVIHGHADHFFEGDKLGGWIVPIVDVWAINNPYLADYQVAAWAPVDHFPAPRDVLKFFHRTNAIPVAMSQFGRDQFLGAGLEPAYVPLSVDTSVYRPTYTVDVNGAQVDARTLFKVPAGAFVVGMVAMNKGWSIDRKGFAQAFRAFGAFWQAHNDAVLYVHSEAMGAAEGINLIELAQHCGVPEHALIFTDQYAYRLGLPATMMAALYTMFDVLLSPSHGEGFCVPLIEAQACGTPVIATDFSAQTELVGAGWLVTGQPEWDPAQHASLVCPLIVDIVAKLHTAYDADREAMVPAALAKAADYETALVYDTYWRPFIATLEPPAPVVRAPMERCDVIVPAMRLGNVDRLADSFNATNDGTASLVYVVDADADDLAAAAAAKGATVVRVTSTGEGPTSYAEKVNAGVRASLADWVCIVGDDVSFAPGWVEAARPLTDRFDVVGTNDTDGKVRNPDVAAGTHADHFFVRRAYVDDEGASLDGPGILAPEAYRHWYVDREIIQLAKARGVFTPCLASVVVHHHPGFDGDEEARHADPAYVIAVDNANADRATFLSRVPLIEAQRTTRAKVR